MDRVKITIPLLFRLLAGTVFLVAGEIKLYDSLVGFTSSRLHVTGINVIPWLGAAELIVGVLVLAGTARRAMTLIVIALLSAFLTYSAILWGLENTRCGCFGAVPVAPGHVFLLDLGLLTLALAALRDALRSTAAQPAPDSRLAEPHSVQAHVLSTVLVWTVLSAFPGRSTAEDTLLREQFLQEFPEAHQRLKHAASHADGEARYLRSTDMANRKVNDKEDMKWGSFRFVTQDDSLRIDQIMPGGGTMTNVSLVLTPGFNFRVLSPNSSGAQLVDVSREMTGELMVTHALYWRDYFPACFTFAEADLQEWMTRPGFQLETVEVDQDDPTLVHVTYQWDGAEWWPNEPPPADFVHEGEWWLSPVQDWAIRKGAYRQSYTYESNGVTVSDLTSEVVVVDVQEIPDLGFVPQRVQITKLGSTSDWSALQEVSTNVCEFSNVGRSTADDEVFTPAALGVPDPRSSVSLWFILLNAGIILLLLAVWSRWKLRWMR
ncbi:MAG: MauE/DoxX family redox-associated membrane protein [Maioricimonas sp. JB049]